MAGQGLEISLAGQGAFGTLYRVHHYVSGASVALKVICNRDGSSTQNLASRVPLSNDETDPRLCYCQFNRELEALRALGTCSNVARLLDWDCHCRRHSLATRQHESAVIHDIFDTHLKADPAAELRLILSWADTDLASIVRCCGGPLPHALVISIARQMFGGLAQMHAAGFAHRDIKPGNILVARDGRVWLGDLGHARRIPDRLNCRERTGTRPRQPSSGAAYHDDNIHSEGGGTDYADYALGEGDGSAGDMTNAVQSRWYRAPEILYGSRAYDAAAIDCWSAGCVLAELLRGEPLLPGATDLQQLSMIHALLGHPVLPPQPDASGGGVSVEAPTWLGASQLPDYHKVSFKSSAPADLACSLPHAGEHGVELVRRLLRWDPAQRVGADAAASHPFFSSPR